MELVAKQKLVKANAKKLGITVKEVTAMPEDQLDLLIAKIEVPAVAEVSSEDVKQALESDATYENEKGDIIPIVNAAFTRVTSGGGFAFAFGDNTIITNDSDLRFLFSKDALKPGDVVAFRPDSIEYNSLLNAYTGQPNKSATPALMKVVDYRNANRSFNQTLESELRAKGLNTSDARGRIQDQIAKETMAQFKRPTFSM